MKSAVYQKGFYHLSNVEPGGSSVRLPPAMNWFGKWFQ